MECIFNTVECLNSRVSQFGMLVSHELKPCCTYGRVDIRQTRPFPLQVCLIVLAAAHRELDHEGVHDAAQDRDEVERVPLVSEVTLRKVN